ncbi:hypothetical protein H4S08_001147 [Coemansia sp. RSA 1365]|nr:hypothetical protein H4S08_001147 [Coemansia sp. RSA 1365]
MDSTQNNAYNDNKRLQNIDTSPAQGSFVASDKDVIAEKPHSIVSKEAAGIEICSSRNSDDNPKCRDRTLGNKLNVMRHIQHSWRRYKVFWVLGIWLLITAYFLASVILKLKTQISDLLPFIFLYVFITGKMFFAFVSTRHISAPISKVSTWVMQHAMRLPRLIRYASGVALLLALIVSVSLSIPESSAGKRIERMQSLLGIAVITLLLTITSKHPRHIQWHTVIIGYLVQFCLGCIVIKTSWGNDLFSWMANSVSSLLEFSRYGAKFLFGEEIGSLENFAMTVFPAFIFFAAFVQMMNYLGAVQWLLQNLGRFVQKIMDTSGAESLVVAAAPFLGQIENALLVKDYLDHMTSSELHACMTAGFATVSGSTLQGYVALGVNAKNIITACIMSIPCSLALSKIRYPETEESMTRGRVVAPPRDTGEANILHAIGNGAMTGINLALLVAANLIALDVKSLKITCSSGYSVLRCCTGGPSSVTAAETLSARLGRIKR